MDYEKEILKLKSEIADMKKKLNIASESDKLTPTKRYYLCKLKKGIYGDRWGNWDEDTFVPIERYIDGVKLFCEFDTAEEILEYCKHHHYGERIYIKDSDTNKVVRPKNFKVKK